MLGGSWVDRGWILSGYWVSLGGSWWISVELEWIFGGTYVDIWEDLGWILGGSWVGLVQIMVYHELILGGSWVDLGWIVGGSVG